MNYTIKHPIEIMEVDQEWLVMDTEQFTMTKVTPLGAAILEGIQAGQSLVSIMEEIHASHEIDRELLKQDVFAYLEELARIGVLSHEES